jgi:hypothetical protein
MTIFNSVRAAIAATATATVLMLGTGAASAATVEVTIDFGPSGLGVLSPYIENGFEVAGPFLSLALFGNPGRSILLDPIRPTLTLTRTDGGAFSLKAFDYYCSLTNCDFTVGGLRTVDVPNGGVWVTRGLDIANITSLVFSWNIGLIYFDNIVLTHEVATTVPPGGGVSVVPVPAGLPLLIAGIGGLGLMARRKTRAA